MKVIAEFVKSAASAADFPSTGPEIALVGRSNVGKSSLINALVRQRLARTSAAPGKTRLANIYRVTRGTSPPLMLVDLPGYGYARGGSGFDLLTRAYFERSRSNPWEQVGQGNHVGRLGQVGHNENLPDQPDLPNLSGPKIAVLLLVDARHPGLDIDLRAWTWLEQTAASTAVVATKIDKLARGERIRALRELQSVFDKAVLPVSAVTAEGLDDLWRLIDNLAHNLNPTDNRHAPPLPNPKR